MHRVAQTLDARLPAVQDTLARSSQTLDVRLPPVQDTRAWRGSWRQGRVIRTPGASLAAGRTWLASAIQVLVSQNAFMN